MQHAVIPKGALTAFASRQLVGRRGFVGLGLVAVGAFIALVAINASGEPSADTLTRSIQPTHVDEEDGRLVVHLSAASASYIKTVTVQNGTLPIEVEGPARVAFRDGSVSNVSVPVGGRVTVVHVRVGDHVKAGEPLFTLSSPEAGRLRGAVISARSVVTMAQDVDRREVDMAKQGVGLAVEKLAADTRLEEAQVNLANARQAAAFLGAGNGDAVVVRAPAEGTVIDRKTAVGTYVDPSSGPVVEIGDPHALWVVAYVFEEDLVYVHPNATVKLTIGSVDHAVAGHVVSVGAAVGTDSRRAPVYIALDAPGVTLRPGMFARATIDGPVESGPLLPAEAVLITGNHRHVIYVADGDGYTARDVTVGRSENGSVRILHGVKSGERVVVGGALLLDGAAQRML